MNHNYITNIKILARKLMCKIFSLIFIFNFSISDARCMEGNDSSSEDSGQSEYTMRDVTINEYGGLIKAQDDGSRFTKEFLERNQIIVPGNNRDDDAEDQKDEKKLEKKSISSKSDDNNKIDNKDDEDLKDDDPVYEKDVEETEKQSISSESDENNRVDSKKSEDLKNDNQILGIHGKEKSETKSNSSENKDIVQPLEIPKEDKFDLTVHELLSSRFEARERKKMSQNLTISCLESEISKIEEKNEDDWEKDILPVRIAAQVPAKTVTFQSNVSKIMTSKTIPSITYFQGYAEGLNPQPRYDLYFSSEGHDYEDKKLNFIGTMSSKVTDKIVVPDHLQVKVSNKNKGNQDEENKEKSKHFVSLLQYDDLFKVTKMTYDLNQHFGKGLQCRTLILPKTLEDIGPGCFRYHLVLIVDLSQTKMTKIPENAFSDSSVQEIIFPECLLEVGQSAFRNSNLGNLKLGKNVKILGETSIADCSNLETVTIENPNALLGFECFSKDTKLKKIFVPCSFSVMTDKTIRGENQQINQFDMAGFVGYGGKYFGSFNKYNTNAVPYQYDDSFKKERIVLSRDNYLYLPKDKDFKQYVNIKVMFLDDAHCYKGKKCIFCGIKKPKDKNSKEDSLKDNNPDDDNPKNDNLKVSGLLMGLINDFKSD